MEQLYKTLIGFMDTDKRVSHEPGSYLSFGLYDFYIRADEFGRRDLKIFYQQKLVYEADEGGLGRYIAGEWEDMLKNDLIPEVFKDAQLRKETEAKNLARKLQEELAKETNTPVELSPEEFFVQPEPVENIPQIEENNNVTEQKPTYQTPSAIQRFTSKRNS